MASLAQHAGAMMPAKVPLRLPLALLTPAPPAYGTAPGLTFLLPARPPPGLEHLGPVGFAGRWRPAAAEAPTPPAAATAAASPRVADLSPEAPVLWQKRLPPTAARAADEAGILIQWRVNRLQAKLRASCGFPLVSPAFVPDSSDVTGGCGDQVVASWTLMFAPGDRWLSANAAGLRSTATAAAAARKTARPRPRVRRSRPPCAEPCGRREQQKQRQRRCRLRIWGLRSLAAEGWSSRASDAVLPRRRAALRAHPLRLLRALRACIRPPRGLGSGDVCGGRRIELGRRDHRRYREGLRLKAKGLKRNVS
eukprot:TRINITY_DN15652_c0_g1_i1.p1 TRINITY_DN15652_c0_g1~~TRINITY_DN15652_c0_g1_i1.p1  ORF type:complete len:309 (+),score=41.60 TRINITY_DN15652_c0_g1_i1:59-985(+)